MNEGWSGMGKISIEGAAKYGHIRRDLRKKTPETDSRMEIMSSGAGKLRRLARQALRAVGLLRAELEQE